MTVLNDEVRALFAGPNIAHLATLPPDGGPYPRGEEREAFLVEPAHVTVPTFG